MNNLVPLFFEFFKVGFLTFGGGYASLPFLYQMVENYDWFSHSQLIQLIAISGLTPGPVGLNMATFAGYNTEGIFGSIISSFAIIIPMLIIASCVFRLYKKFNENRYVKTILYVLRPTGCALLGYVGIKLINNLIIIPKDYMGFVLILILFILTLKFSRNPLIYILCGAVFGVLIWFFKTIL